MTLTTSLAGTDVTAREVLECIRRQGALVRDEKAFLDTILSHDFSDPFASFTSAKTMRDDHLIMASGNRLLFRDDYRRMSSLHVLHDRIVERGEGLTLDAWSEALSNSGWDIGHGGTGFLMEDDPVPGEITGRRADLRIDDSLHDVGIMLMTYRSWEPDGHPVTETLRILSHPDEGRMAKAITYGILGKERGIPGRPEAAREQAVTVVEHEIGKIGDRYGLTPEFHVHASSWKNMHVDMTVLDAMLEPERIQIMIGMRSLPDGKEPRINEASLQEIDDRIRINAGKAALLSKRGRIITSIGRGIQQSAGLRPGRLTKWRRTIKGDIRSSTRLVIRDGIIGGELIVERDGVRILRLLNATFELPGVTLPEVHLATMAGRRLGDYVQHPLVTDAMVIKRARKMRGGVRGTLTDEGRTRYETP